MKKVSFFGMPLVACVAATFAAARHKLLDSIKFLLRDYPLMGVRYHFPFFGQLRGAFLAFHVGGNPLVACKVSRIYRAS